MKADNQIILNVINSKIWILLILCLVIFLSNTLAQDTQVDEPIKVNTFVINVPVIASDKAGRYVPRLKKENFFVIEDDVKREVDFFADEESPMNVAIVIDVSFSTQKILGSIKNIASNFIKILRSEDRGMIVSFDDKINILCELTSDQNLLKQAINSARIMGRGGSNMNDTIYQLVTKDFASFKGRKAIIVLTDGMTGGGLISNKKLQNTLIESDILVYPIIFKINFFSSSSNFSDRSYKLPNGQIISGEEMRKKMQEEYKEQLKFANSLAILSGGRLFEKDSTELKEAFQSIADELKKQYVIGFYPPDINDGKSHRVIIEVNPPDILIRTKRVIHLKPVN